MDPVSLSRPSQISTCCWLLLVLLASLSCSLPRSLFCSSPNWRGRAAASTPRVSPPPPQPPPARSSAASPGFPPSQSAALPLPSHPGERPRRPLSRPLPACLVLYLQPPASSLSSGSAPRRWLTGRVW